MVYTDGSHLVADSLEELHQFAESIGINTYQGEHFPCYTLESQTIFAKAIGAQALLVPNRTILEKSKELGEQ